MTGQLAGQSGLTGQVARSYDLVMAKRVPVEEKVLRIGVSEFKAKCLGLVEQLEARGGRIVITKRGREVAELRALAPTKRKTMYGALRGKLKIKGDIVHFDTTHLWEVLK